MLETSIIPFHAVSKKIILIKYFIVLFTVKKKLSNFLKHWLALFKIYLNSQPSITFLVEFSNHFGSFAEGFHQSHCSIVLHKSLLRFSECIPKTSNLITFYDPFVERFDQGYNSTALHTCLL